MIELVRSTLARLESVKDRVFLSPMTEADLVSLEREVDMGIPSCLREYLRIVGLRQDLTPFGTSNDEVYDATVDFQVYVRAEDFRLSRDFLTEHIGDAASLLFPFGDDGAGDVVAVAQGKDCCPLFFVDHETKKIEELGTFCDWVGKAVEDALKAERPLNTKRNGASNFRAASQTSSPSSKRCNDSATHISARGLTYASQMPEWRGGKHLSPSPAGNSRS